MWDDIKEWFSLDGLGNSEVFSSPKFWLPIAISGFALYYVLNSWQGKIGNLTGYAVMGGLAIVIFGYYWAARDIERNG